MEGHSYSVIKQNIKTWQSEIKILIEGSDSGKIGFYSRDKDYQRLIRRHLEKSVLVRQMGSNLERYCWRHMDREILKTGGSRSGGRGLKAELAGLQKRTTK